MTLRPDPDTPRPVTKRNGSGDRARANGGALPNESNPTSAALGYLVGVIFIGGYFLNYAGGSWSLLGIVAGLVGFSLWLGRALMGRTMGILINNENLMSASRFQTVVWTIVVLSAYLSFALRRMVLRADDPLNFTIDRQLLTLMGISAGSFLTSPLILHSKRKKEPQQAAVEKTAVKANESADEINGNRVGTLYVNPSPYDAKVTDLFQGDEVGNTMHIDLAKVQMFFFTLAGAGTYLFQVALALHTGGTNPDNLIRLPGVSAGLTLAIGLSHLSFLGSKGINHTPLEPRTK